MLARHLAHARGPLAAAGTVLALLMPAVARAEPPLRLLAYPIPGLFEALEHGKVGGPGGELMDKIGQGSGMPYVAETLPITRTLQALQSQPPSCVLGMIRTPEREARFQWVGPLSRAGFAVYARAEATATVSDLSSLRGRSVVVVRGTTTADQLRELGIATQDVGNTLSALRMLQAGRVEFWYAHQLVAEFSVNAGGGPAIKALFRTPTQDGYLACNLEVSATVVDKLRTVLQRLRRDGELLPFGLR